MTSRIEALDKMMRTAMLVPSGDPNLGDFSWSLPFICWGHIGIGKSSGLRRIALELEVPLYLVFGASLDPPDVSGALVPVRVNGETKVRRVPSLPYLEEVIRDRKCILGFEEFATAPPIVQTSLQTGLLDRKFGLVELPKEVRMCAASNSPEHGGVGHYLTPQLANRMLHFQTMHVSPRESADFIRGRRQVKRSNEWKTFSLDEGEKMVIDNWDVEFTKVAMIYDRFITSAAGTVLLHAPPVGLKLLSGPWPTPRSWEMGVHAVTTALCLGEKLDFAMEMMTAAVGQDASDAFSTFVRNLSLPTVDGVLRNEWTHNEFRMDVTYVVLSMLDAHVRQWDEKVSSSEVKRMWELANELDASGLSDLVASLLASLGNKSPASAMKDAQVKKWSETLYLRHSKTIANIRTGSARTP